MPSSRTTAFLFALIFSLPASAEPRDVPLPPEAAAPSRDEWRERIAEARRAHDAWMDCVRRKVGRCPATTKADPLKALLEDDTLRAGDVVSTPSGLRVFRGKPETPHRIQDFN